MAQVTTGVRSVLSRPAVYNAVQRAFGAEASRREFALKYLRVSPNDRVLDIGCGTAEILDHLPDSIEYWGFDLSQEYIAAATERYGDRGRFRCEEVSAYVSDPDLAEADVVLANGVLHHLDDSEALALVDTALQALRSGGRLITLDPTFSSGQSAASRWLVSKDRGQSVRTPEDYKHLVEGRFRQVDVHVRHDLLRIPYSHCVMVCTK